MPRSSSEPLVRLRDEERGFAAAAHLLGAVPMWGLVFLILMWIYFKERSRGVVFHVQQAAVFFSAQLAILLVYVGIGLVLKPIAIINEWLAGVLASINWLVLVVCFGAYIITCLYGTVKTFLGRPFFYPAIGRRVLEGSLLKTRVED